MLRDIKTIQRSSKMRLERLTFCDEDEASNRAVTAWAIVKFGISYQSTIESTVLIHVDTVGEPYGYPA